MIMNQCLFSQFSAKFMKRVSITHFVITLTVMIYFLRVDLAFVKVILLCLSCWPWHKKYSRNLMLIFVRHLWNFLSISKAFHRVWHEALIFKLQSSGISDSLLCLFNSFLSERLQRMVLNDQASESTSECPSKLDFRSPIENGI